MKRAVFTLQISLKQVALLVEQRLGRKARRRLRRSLNTSPSTSAERIKLSKDKIVVRTADLLSSDFAALDEK